MSWIPQIFWEHAPAALQTIALAAAYGTALCKKQQYGFSPNLQLAAAQGGAALSKGRPLCYLDIDASQGHLLVHGLEIVTLLFHLVFLVYCP